MNKRRDEARRLRMAGKSVRYIAQQVCAAKSSVSQWVRDIQLSKSQTRKLIGNRSEALRQGSVANASSARELRLGWQSTGRKMARDDKDFVIGCTLYWAEGKKTKNTVGFSNTDPDMVLYFKGFLERFFDVSAMEYTVQINAYLNNGVSKLEIENYWINLLGLPRTCLLTGVFKSGAKTSCRKNRHKYGVCGLLLHRTDVVQKIFGGIQEAFGIDRPNYLS